MQLIPFDGELDKEPTGNLVPFDGELDEPLDARAKFAAKDPRRLDTDEGAARAADAMPSRSWGQAAGDTVVQLGEGVNTMLGAVPSLVAPESDVAQFFKGNAEYWREQQSDPLKARIASSGRRIEAAGKDGVVAQAKAAASEYWDDPALAARLAVTNIPSMLPAVGVGKMAQLAAAARGASAARTASLATTAAGTVNAAMNAGGARGESFDELKAAHMKAGLSEADATEAALSGSMLPAAVGGAAGFVSGKIGLEKALLGQGSGRAFGRAAGATLAELAGEQLEEVAPQIAGNLQLGKVDGRTGLFDNVGRTMVETGIASAPGAALAGGASMRDTSPEAMLADAINGTDLPAADISDDLRTYSMTGYITPEATAKSGIDRAQAAADTMSRVREVAEAAVDQLKAEAVGDIARAGSVDEAIASATRAVNLDSDKILDDVLAATGIDRAEMDAQHATAKAAVQQGSMELEALAAAREAAAAVPVEAKVESDSTANPEKVWYGRRGNGYVTVEDAGKALAERQKINRGLEWTIEQSSEGRYYLAGRPTAAAQPAGAAITTGQLPTRQNAPSATMPSQEVSHGSPDQLAVRERAAEHLAKAIRASNPSQGDIVVVGGRGWDVHKSAKSPGVRAAVQAASQIADATEAAFGWRPILVVGLNNAFGAQHAGNMFISVERLAQGDAAGNSIRKLAVVNTGHEALHQLEKSDDPADRAAFGRLKAVIMQYSREEAVAARVDREGRGRQYGENEVVADVNGAMWGDQKFWRRVYELDNGSTFRRLAYRTMEAITKLLETAKKGGRWDANTWVTDVDAVREVAAQVWAEKGQRGNLWGNQRGSDERQEISRSIEDVSEAVPGQDSDAAGGARGRRTQDSEVQGAKRALPGYAHSHIQGAAGPDPRLVEVAERYAREHGIEYTRQARYAEIDPEFSKRIADAYEAMPHAPSDPAVKEAYQNLIRQATAQYDALVDAGYKFWFIDLEQNAGYASSPWNAMRDLRQNKSMGVFPTADGFGSTDFDPADNPLLAETGLSWPVGGLDGKMAPVYANDLMRAVHDAFGHGLEGAGFRAQGEENAWQAHARMFTGSAIGALTSETRGQNSFLNFSSNPLSEVLGEHKTRMLYDEGYKGRKESSNDGQPQRGGVPVGERLPGVQQVERDDVSVSKREVAELPAPRRSGNTGGPGAADAAGVSERGGSSSNTKASAGQDQQRRPLRAGESSLGDPVGESQEPAALATANAQRKDAGDIGLGGGARGLGPGSLDAPGEVQVDAGSDARDPKGSGRPPLWKTITVGQNNQSAKVEDTIFADQKTGLMPEWTWRRNFDDGTTGQSSFEVAPDPNDAELSERWNGLPLGEKMSISRDVADAVVPRVLALSGAQGVVAEQTGSYLADTNPSFALRLKGGDLDLVSRHLGYVLSQDGMMNLSPSPFEGADVGRAVIVEMGDASFDDVKRAYDAIRKAVPDVSGQSTAAGEMTILFTDPVDIDALAEKINDALGDQRNVSTKTVYYSFPTKDDYNYASSTNDTGARGALAGELRRGLGDLRAEASRLIAERLERGAPQSRELLPRGVGDSAQDGDGGVEQRGRRDADRGQSAGAPWSGGGSVAESGQPPAYGAAQAGSISVTGYHFSKQERQRLSSAYYGTGLKGWEAERLTGRENDDIRPRIHFYVDAGNGISPEAGVGGSSHHVRLDNIYDVTADPLNIWRNGADDNSRERAVIAAGFDGYIVRDPLARQHVAVLLGEKHESVPVAKATAPAAKDVAPRTMPREERPVTRREGDTLVRKPVGDELLQVVKSRGDIEYVAPSFVMKYGEARVLASEAPLVNEIMRASGSTFAFDEGVSRSFADDELGAFNIDAQMDDIFTEEMTDEDWQAALQAEMDAEIGPAPSIYSQPSTEAIKDAGLMAESAFDLDGLFAVDERGRLKVMNDPDVTRVSITMRDLGDAYSLQVEPRAGSGVFMNAKSDESAKAIIKQQVAGQALHESGFDIASTYRKGTIMKLASEWGKIASKANVFRSLMPTTKSADFDTVAKEMGAFKGYRMENYGRTIEWQGEDGHVKSADINDEYGEISVCTMGLADSSLAPEFYSVVGVVAKNSGKRFKSDSYVSGINSYRRTEQAFSFALKSGDTGVLLPGAQNRVYGYNHSPKTKEDHAKNLARLALAGLRNAQEVFPEVRRLRYDAATDKFTDARGKDAEDVVSKAIADPMAREFGLGRTTIARAVITGQVISGDTESLNVESFAKPVAYSMMDVELDKPLGEAWGDESSLQALNPNLRRFIAGSKIVNEDGTPRVMYHGTARDIDAFRPKQAGAIFITDNPRFADDFAGLSGDRMRQNWREVFGQEDQLAIRKEAAAAIMADKTMKMSERKSMAASALGDEAPRGAVADAIYEAAEKRMPSWENIMPVFVRATAPFDYQQQSDIDDVVFTLLDGESQAGITYDGATRDYTEGKLRSALRGGEWEVIESPEVQDVIRRLGYDSFYIKENGQRNLAVYDPASIKSVFNRGTYSLDDERISFSALDDYIAREGKRMPMVSPQSELDAAIDLSVKAIDAAMKDITSKSPTMPVPIGRVPHALTMLGAPNQVLRIDSSILRKVLVDKHSEDFAGISTRQFVEAIYKPALVLKAGKEMEIVTDILTKNGPVIVPVMFNSATSGGAKSAAVMSAYARPVSGKSGIRSRIDAGNLVYADMLKAPSALTGRAARGAGIIASDETPPASLRAGFPSAVPPKGVVASSSPAPASSGIDNLGAQFLRSTPAAPGLSIVNQNEMQGKPLNPNYAGWSNIKDKILDGITGRRVKTDVDLVGWIGGNYKGDIEDAPSFSRIQGSRFTLEEETLGQKLRRRMQDYFLRSLVVQNAIAEQGGTVNEQTNFYLAEELSHGRRGALMKDFADGTVQPMMEKAVKLGVELEELSLYAYAKHAPERNAYIASINHRFPDGGSGMTNADAAGIIAKVQQEGRTQAFEDLHSDLMGITSANRRVMLDEGLITQAEYDAMEAAYEHYIPLRGFEVVDEKGVTTGRSAGKGFNIRGKETVRALGRKSRAGQLIENAIGDYQRTVDRSERNHVAKVFLNFVLQNPDPELWEIDAAKTRQAMDRQAGQVGVNTTIDKGEDTISVKIAGREVYIKIKDDLLARAMRKAHKDETGDTERFLMRTAGVYTSLLRNTLTRYNPEFAITNSARDYGFGVAAMLDVLGEKGAANFTANYPGAIAASFRDETGRSDPTRGGWDRWFKEYEMAGGVTSGFYVKDLEQISGDIRGMLIDAGSPRRGLAEHLAYNPATKFVKLAGRVLELAGAVSENAARVAAYRAAREMGKTKAEAASIAKNLTTNFDRKGELGQLTNAFYVFYNAAVQGSHRIAVMMKNKKVWSYMGGLTSASIMLALASVEWGGDDEDDGIAYWDKIPGYVKERNIIIMLPPGDQMEGTERVGSKGRYISIPVQYGINWFSATGYAIADVIRWSKDKTVGKSPLKGAVELASITAGAFNPFGGSVDLGNGSSVAQAALPSMADVVVQLSTGTNGFGRDVAPFKSPFDTKPDSENYNLRQADGTAHKVARWLNSVSGGSEHESGGIDLAPGTVENVWRNLTGGTGQFIYDGVNLAGRTIERHMGGDPDIFTRDIPLLRRVYGETGGDVDQGIFYENRKKTEEAAGVVKRKAEAGVEPTEEQAAFAGLNKPAGQITRDLAKIRRQMIEVKQDASISEGEKTLRTRELRAARDRLTAEFNRAFMEVLKETHAN